MLSNYYAVVSASFATRFAGYVNGQNTFRATRSIDGRYVCALCSLLDFPEIFADTTITITTLGAVDFPVHPPFHSLTI
ncbi:hypothetical protein LGH70_19485 [Hymenobacter sp. BT635]|uniref:Uncharacterized protein n=1 Tax=Hymenobacter nitidus TaxID=2880929 RepID=A0ABS8AH66_9BACT|nr:hypothetical protein [Hymenobacter nitidus]MCB2379788.1 hypothetical protein [Hymenobacter nitidus]